VKPTSPITETGHPRPFKHADEADYAAFLERIPMDDSFRRQRLLYRSRFVDSWPDINEWFSAPLPNTRLIRSVFGRAVTYTTPP